VKLLVMDLASVTAPRRVQESSAAPAKLDLIDRSKFPTGYGSP